MRQIFVLPMAWCLVALVGTSAGAGAAPIMPLVAHQAVYDLALVPGSNPQTPTAARGRIVYHFSGSSCEGYESSFRQMTLIEPGSAPPRLSDVVSETFEDGAGKNFRFKVHSTINDKADQDIDGKASLDPGGQVMVDLQRPKPTQFSLSPGILFPTSHIQHIIAAALKGETTLSEQIYDGSEPGRKTFDTLTVIGKIKVGAAANKVAQIGDMGSVPRWPVTISYFDHQSHKDMPDYILSFDLYQNGISRHLKLDYGTFVLKGTLVDLKLLPKAPPCR